MEMITVLQLESQLSVKSFCEALEYSHRLRIDNVKEVFILITKYMIIFKQSLDTLKINFF